MSDLERRLLAVEDQLAIMQLIAAYGPAVDTGDANAAAALWSEDGTYDVAGMPPFEGAAAVGALVELPEHEEYLRRGCAHVLSLPRISVDGDTATAVCYSRLYVRDGPAWAAARVSANRWKLERSPDGWRVRSRENRTLDGDAMASGLLRADR